MSGNKFNYLLKYIIIGDSGVGKSNILLKYTQNRFNEEHQLTIGVEFGAKSIKKDNKIYRVQIWDTAGQETFRSITRSYYKNSVCAIVCYDITKRQTFENIENWIQDCKMLTSRSLYLILIGNKSDLVKDRKVTYEEGQNLATNNGMYFLETSAKTGTNISKVFEDSVEIISKKIKEGFYNLDTENCGIKIGELEFNNKLEKNQNIVLDKIDDKNFVKKSSCCKKK